MNPQAVIQRMLNFVKDWEAYGAGPLGFEIKEVLALVSYRADEAGESATVKVTGVDGVQRLLNLSVVDQEIVLEISYPERASKEGKPIEIKVDGRTFTLRWHSPVVFELSFSIHPFSSITVEAKHLYRKIEGGVERTRQAYYFFGSDSSEWGWDGQKSYATEAADILDAVAKHVASTALSA